ncbi:MAG: hypothetical protein ACOYNY_14650 [Caldilineaceae bacterium]
MQYFKPAGDFFLGDCMPFAHDGVFHLFYLLDEGHHKGLGGLGGHQWAHATTTDLVHWQHHPLALPISAEWEGSICTGSPFYQDGVYHAFYATRMRDWTQHLGHAVSTDGIHFEKTTPNPFATPPPGYSAKDYRDPFVFQGDDGRFHMLLTAKIEDYPLADRGGCLLHLTSADLWQWEVVGPMLIPGADRGGAGVPECPDCFEWNGWYYLLFGLRLQTHYRMARHPLGPWVRPPVDVLDTRFCAVMKTAPFGANRRIGVGWAGPRDGDKDGGRMLWGGNAVFRELIQHPDGSLGTRFPPEMTPGQGDPHPLTFTALTAGCSGDSRQIAFDTPETLSVAALDTLPANCRVRCRVEPGVDGRRFGLGLRGHGAFAEKYDLTFDVPLRTVTLAQERIESVSGLDAPFTLEVILNEDIIDVCIGEQRCIINRLPELQGDRLFFFCENGAVQFTEIEVNLLLSVLRDS